VPVINPTLKAPRWYWVPARVLVLTFVLTLLAFAISLFLGILITVIVAWLRGVQPNFTVAYRQFAAPVALFVAAVVLVAMTFLELHRYRQAKALAQIESAG
jgi:hypothetical protein